MKKLTEGQRFALAREARRLAMECVDGTAPQFGRDRKFTDDGQPCCVAGHLQMRAGLGRYAVLCGAAFSEALLLVRENDLAVSMDRHAAVIFPLLALADALEAAGASKTQKEAFKEQP